uniref:Uncharacterized LOC100007503 n=1 Tax=Danio rerio TaxID=7955 RepID=A0ACD6B6E1_DANRE|nr:uncharacterized protein LOC100007503 [Danio rerio]XP_017208769.1 uncharacterized protein LOC100007503 [Danio rerio]XP_017208770.1 uncharacterized protein LOC100007503 [Danio rerio]|eukprot:XP_017208768.1 uncharacterized protein LOC100007503 [Danio rerio]
MEGDSITLYPGVTDIQKNMLIYKFGAEGAFIALKDGNHISVNYDVSNEGFKGRLHLDQTGALTISDSKTSDSGVYELNIIGGREDQVKKFCVTIYPRLPAPDIIRTCPQNSSSSVSEHLEVSRCELLCSVVNVSAVSLSWYKGNSILSSISVSDLSSSLSLPLEVEHQDNNTYSCVINNTISNQTTNLDITTLCQSCEECPCCGSVESVMRLVISALVGVAAAAFVVEDIRSRKGEQENREETSC